MDDAGRQLYREYTPWALWVYLLLWGSLLGAVGGIWADGGYADLQRVGLATVLLLSGVGLHLLFGGLTVVVYAREIRVGLGRGWPLRTRIALDEVESMDPVTYSPLREFGGWGLRGSRGKRAWTARGNRALVLTLTDGRRIYLGSDDPARLEGRIRNAMSVGNASA